MFWLTGSVVVWVLVGVGVQMALGQPDQTVWMWLKAIPWESIKGVAAWPVTLWNRWKK